MTGVTLRATSHVALLLLSSLAAFANQTKPDSTPLYRDVTAKTQIGFVHKSDATPEKYMMETFGAGVASIDYDNDGFQDLFFVNSDPGTSNALYRNRRNGTFEDVTQRSGLAGKSGYRHGVAVGDIDNDHDLDLYITALGPNTLYRNNGDGTFSDVTAAAGVAGAPDEWSTSAGFFDYDRDGDLDLYVVNYLDYRKDDNPYCGFRRDGYRMYCSPAMFDGKPDRLFRNNGDGTFADVSQHAGIANPAGKGLGVTFCDFDQDADTDIYVANDGVRNFLYRNEGDGTFRDVAYGAGVGFDGDGRPQAGMGVDCADVDGDGLPEIFVTNLSEELNTLYQNLGGELFEDVSLKAGLGSGYLPLGFGTRMFDADNDGDLDIYVTNGHVIDNIHLFRPTLTYEQTDLLYANAGGKFADVSVQSGAVGQVKHIGRGLATGDFDNDGRLDVVISNVGQPPMVLRNEGQPLRNWIMIRARGRKSNTFGLGTRVRVETSAGVQIREVNNVASYLSSNDIRLHVGLGDAAVIRRVDLEWPSGAKQMLTDVGVNQVLTVQEP